MVVTVECSWHDCEDRVQCEWWPLRGRTDGEVAIEVVLPDGWAIDYNGVDAVIHCEAHRTEL